MRPCRRRSGTRSTEGAGVPVILVAGYTRQVEQVAITRAHHASSPALAIHAAAEIRKRKTAAILSMAARRRRAGADHDGVRQRPVAERIFPVRRKPWAGLVIQGIVEILRPVTGGFDDDHPFRRRELDGQQIVRPPLHADVSFLARIGLITAPRPRPVHFEQDDVAGLQFLRRQLDRLGRPDRAMGNGTDDGSVRDAGDPESVGVAAHFRQHRGPVVTPAQVGIGCAADEAAVQRSQVGVGQFPGPFHIGNDHAASVAAREAPCVPGVDTARRGVEISLQRCEIGDGGRRFHVRSRFLIQPWRQRILGKRLGIHGIHARLQRHFLQNHIFHRSRDDRDKITPHLILDA
jgi:hypothetical protein